jgi:hypothetical protein
MHEKNFMSLAGELLMLLEVPALLNRHCARVAPELAEANDRVFQAWQRRNAPLLDLARVEIARANRYLALPTTEKEPGAETVEKMLVHLEAAVVAKVSRGGPEAERQFCRDFPNYLYSIEQSQMVQIAEVLAQMERVPKPAV